MSGKWRIVIQRWIRYTDSEFGVRKKFNFQDSARPYRYMGIRSSIATIFIYRFAKPWCEMRRESLISFPSSAHRVSEVMFSEPNTLEYMR